MLSEILDKRLTTIQVYYFMPDHPNLLQEYLWQTLDLPPQFPRMRAFLRYWHREIDAVINSVQVSVAGIVQPFPFRTIDIEIKH